MTFAIRNTSNAKTLPFILILHFSLCLILLPSLSAKPLSVLTLNVLADPWKVEQRIPPLLDILESSDADIIALQEVAPWFAQQLATESWLSNYHYPKTDSGLPAIAHEHLVLTKLPQTSQQLLSLPSQQGRIAYFVTINLNNRPLTLVTLHLDSYLEDGPIRAQQLNTVFQNIPADHDAIVLGDFNFGDSEQPDTDAISPDFQDPWLLLHPNAPGYTWDRSLNPKARRDSFPREKSRRLDRILFRSPNLTPKAISLIANQPVSKTKPPLFPSDHFGLLATFQTNTEKSPSGN